MATFALVIFLPLVFSQVPADDIPSDLVCEGGIDDCGIEPAGLSLLQKNARVVDKANLTAKNTLTDTAKAHEKTNVTRKSRRLGRSGGAPWFFDVESMDVYQLIVCTIFYGYVLYVGSNMLGDGSEQLGFFSSVRGIVGSVVVPILGAVPDSMMVLMSGLGADAQEQVTTGVGALAGSTVMLLTFPWFVVNLAGSVPCDKDGKGDYKRAGEPTGFFDSAVTYGPSVWTNSKIMVLTSLSFLIIQIPAWFMDHNNVPLAEQAKAENMWSLIGLIVSLLFFVGYIAYCWCASDGSDLQLKVIKEGIKSGDLSLTGAICANQDNTEELLQKILPYFFNKYDDDSNKQIDIHEFSHVLRDLGEPAMPKEDLEKEYAKANTDKGDEINLKEFTAYMATYISSKKDSVNKYAAAKGTATPATRAKYAIQNEDGDDDDDVEVPEDLVGMSPEEMASAMLWRSMFNMIVGTILVCLFADPAVDLFDEWGVKLGISSFYVGFLLAPFASNASELLVAYGMALKKSSKSVTMSFESLIGAACMNNTLCLAVFFALIYFKDLAWKFKAETLAILIIQWMMAAIVLSGDSQRKVFGFVILALYPLCLLIVWFCENVLGWD